MSQENDKPEEPEKPTESQAEAAKPSSGGLERVPNQPVDRTQLVDATPIDGIPAEVLEQMPPEVRRVVEASISMSMMRMGPIPSPVAEKITPEHIGKLIDNTEKDSQRESDAQRRTQWMTFGTLLAILILVGVILFIPAPTQFAQDTMKVLIGVATGGVAGYGIGRRAK